MAGSLGLVMLDPQYQVVYANDEALSALVTPSENNNGCTQASVMQNLQDLIGRLTGGKAPAQFNHAGRSWRLIRFTLPNGAKREQMSALIIGPGASEQSHAETFGRMFKLTVRETEALELFMKGLSVKETAAKMKISSSTAKAFLRFITIKMGVSGRAEMMSNLLNYMCAASLTCPFHSSFGSKTRTNPKDEAL